MKRVLQTLKEREKIINNAKKGYSYPVENLSFFVSLSADNAQMITAVKWVFQYFCFLCGCFLS